MIFLESKLREKVKKRAKKQKKEAEAEGKSKKLEEEKSIAVGIPVASTPPQKKELIENLGEGENLNKENRI